jgi:hypothetical protein
VGSAQAAATGASYERRQAATTHHGFFNDGYRTGKCGNCFYRSGAVTVPVGKYR